MAKAIVFKTRSNEKIYPCPYYPIGSIYISINSTNPSTYFGGTWEQIKDRFLLACGNSYSNGSTGGEANHTLTTNEVPSHTHTVNGGSHYHRVASRANTYGSGMSPTYRSVASDTSSQCDYNGDITNTATEGGHTHSVSSVGGGQSHNNMPPYLAVYVWKRVS